jgi:hypothetical protein
LDRKTSITNKEKDRAWSHVAPSGTADLAILAEGGQGAKANQQGGCEKAGESHKNPPEAEL